MTSEIAPRLARNSIYYAIKSVVALVLMLLVMPYAVGVLGKDVYGVWALAVVVTSYAQLSDFGIAESVVKYAAEYRAHQDGAAINRLFNTVLVAYVVLAALIGGVLWLALPWVARDLLLIPAPLLEEAVLIFRLATGLFFVNMVTGVFASLILATQQMGYTTTVNIVSACLGALGAVIFLWQGFGLRGLILTHALVALVTAVLNVWFARRLFVGLEVHPLRWTSVGTFREIFSYSWKAQTSNLAQLLVFQLDRVLISRYLGLEAVTFYEVGSNAALYVRTFAIALFSPMMPAAADLNAKADRTQLVGLYRRAFKFAVLAAVPLCLLVVGLAQPFVFLWMGAGFELSALTLQLLLPAFLVNVLTAPGIFLLNGMGRPELAMRAAVLAGASNLLLCMVLIQSVGYFGLIGGIAASLTVAAIYFWQMLHRVLPELAGGLYRPALLKPLLICTPLAVALHLLGEWLQPVGLPVFGLLVLGYVGAVVATLLASKHLDEFERRVLVEALAGRKLSQGE